MLKVDKTANKQFSINNICNTFNFKNFGRLPQRLQEHFDTSALWSSRRHRVFIAASLRQAPGDPSFTHCRGE
jgi:hypothetical protein